MLFRITALTIFLFTSAVWAGPGLPQSSRIVFLGDSITDGDTYPLLVEAAIREAKLPVPGCFNAGVGGDNSQGMLGRLDRDVFRHRPTIVTISAGINDTFTTENFRENILAIADAVQSHGATAVLMTTSIVRDKSPARQARLDGYNSAIRDLARQKNFRLAEVYQLMDREPDAANKLLVEDGIHPNYFGQQVIARAVLDALGYQSVALPRRLSLGILPGVIRQWHIRVAAKNEPELNEQAVATLVPGSGFETLNLPGRQAGDPAVWKEQERQRGFAIDIAEQVGKGERYFGLATVSADRAKSAVLNTGANLNAVWLNGKRVYKSEGWTGWHAFKEQIPVTLEEGVNTLVIDTGSNFFLSLTDTDADQSAIAQAPTYPADVPDTMHGPDGIPYKGWIDRHVAWTKTAREGAAQVYFTGDSITDYWQTTGASVWNKSFAPLKAVDFGMAGDETQHVLWRLQNGELDGVKAKVAVLMIGTNNLSAHPNATPEEVARGIESCVQTIQDRVPGIRILVLSILPRGKAPDDSLRLRSAKVNHIIEDSVDRKTVFYVELNGRFLNADKSINQDLLPDLVHPSAKGYATVAEVLAPAVRELLKEGTK